MGMYSIDAIIVAFYFLAMIFIGYWHGRGKQGNPDQYFISKGTLPWWVIAAAYVSTGMNTEQLIGQNGMGYKIGLTMVNWYLIAIIVYSALIFIFLPIYLRNGILTMPDYLARRYDKRSANVFSVILLLSYVFINLAVVFYGGAKLLEVVMGIPIWAGAAILGITAGLYTTYGGMSSASYTAVIQFILIFVSGFALFFLAFTRLPNGWQDVIGNAPGGFHLIQPMDYPVIPWHAIPLTVLGLHLYYSCINQALVQRGFGARTEWDAKIAIIAAGFFVLLRPFVEILPGMMCRAIGASDPAFNLGDSPEDVDVVFPLLVKLLVPQGLIGLMLVGILSSVMSTISAYLNSISTLFTFEVYKKWISPGATEKETVRVGIWTTLFLMIFSVFYSPLVGMIGGGIFNYFQSLASYLAVPIATVFLLGVFWKRATAAASLTILIGGIPLGLLITWVIPRLFESQIVSRYSLDNFFIISGITHIFCILIMIVVSLGSQPRKKSEISPLLFSQSILRLPSGEQQRTFVQSVGFWWSVFAATYIAFYWIYW